MDVEEKPEARMDAQSRAVSGVRSSPHSLCSHGIRTRVVWTLPIPHSAWLDYRYLSLTSRHERTEWFRSDIKGNGKRRQGKAPAASVFFSHYKPYPAADIFQLQVDRSQ